MNFPIYCFVIRCRIYYSLALHVQVTQICEFSPPLHCDQIQNDFGLAEASLLHKNQGVTAVVGNTMELRTKDDLLLSEDLKK